MAGVMRRQAPRRVLVVNDDVRLADSVRGLLSDAGYDAAIASDGRAGLAILAEAGTDLVLLDLIMPGLDGWGFLRQLANRPASARPLVLVWSVADPDELERARQLGAAACLPRASTNPDQLLDTIAHLLEASPAA
jgi:CheY-like chemotaxis protein